MSVKPYVGEDTAVTGGPDADGTIHDKYIVNAKPQPCRRSKEHGIVDPEAECSKWSALRRQQWPTLHIGTVAMRQAAIAAAIFGTIVSMDGVNLVISYGGVLTKVDASTAIKTFMSVKPYVGEDIAVTGEPDVDGTIHDKYIVNAKPPPWPKE
jgi:hypothetical protein